jgi:hypothetical protein
MASNKRDVEQQHRHTAQNQLKDWLLGPTTNCIKHNGILAIVDGFFALHFLHNANPILNIAGRGLKPKPKVCLAGQALEVRSRSRPTIN